MQDTTSREFVEWSIIVEESEKEFTKQDYYLAQIAAEVRRSFVKNPSKVLLKDFFLQFEEKEKPKMTREQATTFAKAAWFGRLGIGDKK